VPFYSARECITSTPVIDLPSGTLYVLVRSKVAHTFGDDEYSQTLHALAITTGVEKFGGPKVASDTAPPQIPTATYSFRLQPELLTQPQEDGTTAIRNLSSFFTALRSWSAITSRRMTRRN
jgi:hypothetical protein